MSTPAIPSPRTPDMDDSNRKTWHLVERAQAGDNDAFGELYRKYASTIFKFVHFRVGNRCVAEDLTADTFVRALKRINHVEWQGRDIGAWLVTIARNLVADHYKSGRVRLEKPCADVLDQELADDMRETSPEDIVADYLTNRALLEAVMQLSGDQKQCIIMRFLQGLSVLETAEAMGKNEGAIKALQYRAVRSLGRLLPAGFAA